MGKCGSEAAGALRFFSLLAVREARVAPAEVQTRLLYQSVVIRIAVELAANKIAEVS
jgi:hypothetical protein